MAYLHDKKYDKKIDNVISTTLFSPDLIINADDRITPPSFNP